MVGSLVKEFSVPHVRFNSVRYTNAIRRKRNLLDDGIVDTLGSVGARRRAHFRFHQRLGQRANPIARLFEQEQILRDPRVIVTTQQFGYSVPILLSKSPPSGRRAPVGLPKMSSPFDLDMLDCDRSRRNGRVGHCNLVAQISHAKWSKPANGRLELQRIGPSL